MKKQTPLIDIHPDHWEIVSEILKEHVPQYEVWAFGSRATWNAKEFSDLDLAVISDTPLPLSIIASLSEAFSESDLPWKVDMVDWASTSESFREIIERDKVVVLKEDGLGIKELRQTADGVNTMRLSDLVDFNPDRLLEKGISAPFIEMADLTVDNRDVTQIGMRVFRGGGSKFANGDTLFARITPCLENGKTAKVIGLLDKSVGHGSTEFIVMSAKDKKHDEEFVYYLARSPGFRSFAKSQMAGTSGRQRVSWQALSNYETYCIDKTARKKIGDILASLDNLIAANRSISACLEAMARAMFKAWFVDFEPVRAKLEGRWQRGQSLPGLPAHLYDLFPDRLVESELGEIPEGWGVVGFTDIVEIIGGGTPKTSIDEYWNGNIPWFSVVDTPRSSDVFVVQTEKSITQAGLNGSSAQLIDKGTTIISARGTVGNLALAGCQMAFNQSCYALRGKNGTGNYFVFLSTQRIVERLREMAHGSVFSTITRQTFETVRTVLPPANLLQQFERSAASWLDVVLINVNKSQTLSKLRDTLLPKLISGELRVTESKQIIEDASQ